MITAEQRRRLQAGADLVAALRTVEDRGSNLVGALLAGRPFVAFEHHPPGDVFEAETGAQYYFHAHAPGVARPGGVNRTELGHIHTFFRPAGRADGAPIHHIVAIALDGFGRPACLFTTNRWVTGEDFVNARRTRAFARRYKLNDPAPASRCVTALFTLFADEIAALLVERDAAIKSWQLEHPERDALDDRLLEVTSLREIDLPGVLADLRNRAA